MLDTVALEVSTRSLEELEQVIERGQQTFVEVGLALTEIRDRRLYHEQGFQTFEAYCQERWNWAARHGRRLIESASIVKVLQSGSHGTALPDNERQARELVPLLKDEQEMVTVWRDLREQYGDNVTGPKVKQWVSARLEERKRKEEKRAQPTEEAPAQGLQYTMICTDIAASRDHIAAESVDFIITDPPYPRKYLPAFADLAKLAAHALKFGGSLIVMVGQSYLPDVLVRMTPYINYQWALAYLTPGGQSAQLWERNVNTFWKPVLWFVKGQYDGRWIGDVAKSAPNDNDKRFHDWGQSESSMADLVQRFSKPGDVILDPFCGGGTTGVVALQLGRQFVGMGNDPEALAVAQRRLYEVTTCQK